MGKVNLNKKNKSEKDATFKRQKVLGKGKHQHLSHTKIDLKTQTLKVPTQSKFENVEQEPKGPTLQQLLDLITLCHSDNDKKVRNALVSFLSFLPRASDLFLQKISEVLAATLHHLRNPDQKIREAAQNVISWIFGRYSQQCSPFIPVFRRHIGASVSSLSPSIKLQSAFLLDKISTLPNLQPLPSLFELFPLMISASTTSNDFSLFAKTITKVLSRFSIKKEIYLDHSYEEFQAMKLFPDNTATFSQRFSLKCALESSEVENISKLLNALQNSFQFLSGESESYAVSDLCNLLRHLYNLQSEIDLKPFFTFVGERFPYEEGSIKVNVSIAKFLLLNNQFYPQIKEYIQLIPPTVDNIVLFATIGDFSSILKEVPGISEALPELCRATISFDTQPQVVDLIIGNLLQEKNITKRSIQALINLQNKNEDFQPKLFQLVSENLFDSSQSIKELLLILVSSSAPLRRPFLKDYAYFISEQIEDNDICQKCIDSVAITNGTTDTIALLSFFMTIGAHRSNMREYVKNHISRLRVLSEDDSRPFFDKIDLEKWTIRS